MRKRACIAYLTITLTAALAAISFAQAQSYAGHAAEVLSEFFAAQTESLVAESTRRLGGH